jgi:uncharacterized repeat protein (TIGR01451 family)
MAAVPAGGRELRGDPGRSRARLVVAVIGTSLAFAASADAQGGGGQSADRWVTIAARECDSYSDIRANLARNNLMESLQDLGRDTLYESGEPVDPRKEKAGQPRCRPITGWRFTFGDAIGGQPVVGPWGSLSVVDDPDGGQPVVTKATVPARDFNGHPVSGGVKIPGAITIGLNHDQADRAERNALWLQGGTPQDPVLDSDPQFAGGYGFGALRCAIDDLNGDNVETIQFPGGTRHMYCYAYYVTPPPSSGTIVIRKEVVGSQAPETFAFGGNVSYNAGGAFELTASESDADSIEFVRAETGPGDAPWTVVEDPRDGWTLTDISCTSQASTTATDPAAGSAQISLVAGDTVTCTFTNRLTPPAGALVLRKVTKGGTGRFPFRIQDEDGDVVATRALTTTAEGGVGAVRAIALDPGRYRIAERRPRTDAGVWRLTGIACNGARRPIGEPVFVDIDAGRGAVCTFTNRLQRPGRIDIEAITLGGVGTAGYVVSPVDDATVQRRQFATTDRQRSIAAARGQSTHGLPFGRYLIQETAITAAQRDVWSLIAVSCNGAVIPFEQGRVTVRISRRTPAQDCTFINLRRRDPNPPPPDPGPGPPPGPDPQPGPEPVPPGPTPAPGGKTPDLALDKQRVRSTGGDQPTLTFRIRVDNRSGITATDVVVADRLAAGTRLVSARPSQGRCLTRGPRLVLCPLGDLGPHRHADIRVRVEQSNPSSGVNVALVGAGSPEDRLRNNLDSARVPAFEPPPPDPPPGACRC